MTPRREGTAGDRAVLWDLDGTLVESAEQHWQAWRETLDGYGVTVTRGQFNATFGLRNDAILSRWLGPRQPPAWIQEVGDAKEARYRELVTVDGLTALPGADEWTARLAGHGWRQAVASSAPRLNVEVVVKALGFHPRFDAIVGAEDVRHGKPAPDVFLQAAGRLDLPGNRCIVVEDAPAGIEAARRAGMRSIGVGSPGFAPADTVVASLLDLPLNAFDRLLGS